MKFANQQNKTKAKGQKVRQNPWTTRENDLIALFVQLHGYKNWTGACKNVNEEIHAGAFIRSPRQCREHWKNYLDPRICKSPWTVDEDRILINSHETFRNHWAEMEKLLPGRTENCIKNHWNSILKATQGKPQEYQPEVKADEIDFLEEIEALTAADTSDSLTSSNSFAQEGGFWEAFDVDDFLSLTPN